MIRCFLTVLNFVVNWVCIWLLSVITIGFLIDIIWNKFNNGLALILALIVGLSLFIVSRIMFYAGCGIPHYIETHKTLRPASELDRKILFHIIDDLCNRFQVKKPMVYINDAKEINACVVGNSLLVINQGLISFASRQELEAVLAHEIGHIVNGDGFYHQYNYILATIGALLLTTSNSAAFAFTNESSSVLTIAISIPFLVFTGILRIAKFAIDLIMHLGGIFTSPAAEYRADQYAVKAELTDHLISFGEKMMSKYPDERKNYRFLCTHPTWKRRIERLKTA